VTDWKLGTQLGLQADLRDGGSWTSDDFVNRCDGRGDPPALAYQVYATLIPEDHSSPRCRRRWRQLHRQGARPG
jgi:hypothetical protein